MGFFTSDTETVDGTARSVLADLPDDSGSLAPYDILHTVDQKAGPDVDQDDVVATLRDLDDEIDRTLATVGPHVDQKDGRVAGNYLAETTGLDQPGGVELVSAVADALEELDPSIFVQRFPEIVEEHHRGDPDIDRASLTDATRDVDTDTEADSETTADADANADVGADREPDDTDPSTESGTDATADADAATVTEAGTDSESASAADTDTMGSDTTPDSDTTTHDSGTDTDGPTGGDADTGGDVDQKQDEEMDPLDVVEQIGGADKRETIEDYAESVGKSGDECAAEWIAENVPSLTVEGFGDDGGDGGGDGGAAAADQAGGGADSTSADQMGGEYDRDGGGTDQMADTHDQKLNERVAAAVTSDEVIGELATAVSQKMLNSDEFTDELVEEVDQKGDFATTPGPNPTAPSDDSTTVGETNAITKVEAGTNGGDDQ